MDRFFLIAGDWTPERLRLAGEEGHHAVRVMRKKVGDRIEVFDGEGRWARGQVESVEKTALTLFIETEGASEAMQPQVQLAVAIPKGKMMDWIVQKAVELGVSRIQPLVTTNTVVKPAAGKDDKWQRVALEACKQCGQNHLPQVAEPMPYREWLSGQSTGLRLIASLAECAHPMRELLAGNFPEQITILVGPEGDFTLAETEAAIAFGFSPITLGDIVLRVETACLYVLAAVRYQCASR